MSDRRSSFIATFGSVGAKGASLSALALGQRGAALCQMAEAHLPVPPGFVLNIEACRVIAVGEAGSLVASHALVDQGIAAIERATDTTLGDSKNLLLLAVRPSTPTTLPGSLEAVLNLGLNDETVEGLGATAGDHAFAQECYRRLIQNYGQVVLGDDPAAFDDLLNLYIEERGYVSAREIRGTEGPELAAAAAVT